MQQSEDPIQKSRRQLHNDALAFPLKLNDLLENAEKDGDQDIVSWLEDGKAFRIHNRDAFCEKIMKLYFKQSKFTSFTRQLYLYGFSKITTGRNEGGFCHPHFKRNDTTSSYYLLKRNTYSDRRMKNGTSSTDSYCNANSRSMRSRQQVKKKKRPLQEKSKTTQEMGEIFLRSSHLEKVAGEEPRHQSSTEHHQCETFFDDNLWHPVQNENALITLSLSSKPMTTGIWHEDETCWDLEPRPIEDMIISS